jgi:hypothetical protein
MLPGLHRVRTQRLLAGVAHFILMLTRDDRTVPDAFAAYEQIRDTGLTYVGFKDIGIPFEEMRALAARIHEDDRQVMFEVVSTSREDELRSVQSAIGIGADYVLGGRHVSDALPLLGGTRVRYFPFCGAPVGHPTRLEGTIGETVADARRLTQLPGVHGLDLLGYRFAGDAVELTRRVVEAAGIPVIAAGSIDRPERVRAVCDARVWGFTIGTALFEGKFGGARLAPQVRSIAGIEGVSE